MKITAQQMELALARFFNYRQNLIIPNVSYGFVGNYEADLLVVSQSNYVHEIEIKVTRSDLQRDFRKSKHAHSSNKIAKFSFALPNRLKDSIDLIPEKYGVILVPDDKNFRLIKVVRAPKLINKYKLANNERLKLAELGSMRIWLLKQKLNEMRDRLK